MYGSTSRPSGSAAGRLVDEPDMHASVAGWPILEAHNDATAALNLRNPSEQDGLRRLDAILTSSHRTPESPWAHVGNRGTAGITRWSRFCAHLL